MRTWLETMASIARGWLGGGPDYVPDPWNRHAAVHRNNCYDYARDRRSDMYTQPGGRLCEPRLADLVRGAIADGLVPCERGCRRAVALVIWPGRDYHWYRRDRDGKWSHKPGCGPVTCLDDRGELIGDPRTASRGPYTQFGGFFCVVR